MNVSEIIHTGKRITNYEKDATGATTLWPTDTTYVAECPANKRWWLIGGACNRDVNATFSAFLKEAGGDVLIKLATYSAAVGVATYPYYGTGFLSYMVAIDAGEYIELVFGASQTAGAYASCVVIEVSV